VARHESLPWVLFLATCGLTMGGILTAVSARVAVFVGDSEHADDSITLTCVCTGGVAILSLSEMWFYGNDTFLVLVLSGMSTAMASATLLTLSVTE